MALVAANAHGTSTGAVYVGAVGTTAPTTPTATLAVGFSELGWLGEDGVKQAFSFDTEDRRAIGGVLLRRVITGSEITFNFRIEERNATVWGLYYPGSTTSAATGITTRIVKTPVADPRAFVFQLDDGAVHTRIVVARGEITDRGDVEYNAEGYEFTMTCYPDSAGENFRIITDDTAV